MAFVHKVASIFNLALPDWDWLSLHPECKFSVSYTTRWFLMVLSPVELLVILSCAVAVRFFLMRGVVIPCKRMTTRCWLRLKHQYYVCVRADTVASNDAAQPIGHNELQLAPLHDIHDNTNSTPDEDELQLGLQHEEEDQWMFLVLPTQNHQDG